MQYNSRQNTSSYLSANQKSTETSLTNKGVLATIGNDHSTKQEIIKKVKDFNLLGKEKGISAQVEVSKEIITENVTMYKALETMASTLEEYQEEVEQKDKEINDKKIEIEAYQKTLGRKLTQQEINDFLTSFRAPPLIVDKNKAIMDRLMKNLNNAKSITGSNAH